MNVGIIGGGSISDTHARAARAIPGVGIAAVYAQAICKAEALTHQYGGAAYDDLERFLSHRPMDLVAVGSPSGLHAAHGTAAANRGLHVLVEKPLDVTTAKADALIQAADRAGVKLGVFFQDRLKPDVRRLKTMVDQGGLGTPVLASARVKWHRPPEYYAGSRWRGTFALDGGGALINQAIHTVDLLLWLFGAVQQVYGRTATRVHAIEAEDTAVATLQFTSGALGVLEAATSVYPGYARRLELSGSGGTLILDHDRLVVIDLRSDGARAASSPATEQQENVASAVVSDAAPHRGVFEDFIQAIASNGTPACDGREGRRSLEVVEAIYASARSDRAVTLVTEA
jgi:UDP-N-acetyl-2-amino-2-deoxyglucuronate dehydrogenase